MSSDKFVHLHVHTEYSLLDGAGKIEDYFAKAAEDGMPALAATDHGNLHVWPELLRLGQKYGVKPIPGCEIYLEPEIMGWDRKSIRSMNKQAKDSGDDSATGKQYFHQTTLAMNETGYQSLIQMQSQSWLDNYYYKPMSSLEMLDQYSDGIIATSSCLGGVPLQHIMRGEMDKAEAFIGHMVDIYGPERYFIELQRHGIVEQDKTNPVLLDLAKKFGLKAIATNDCHYTNCNDHASHDALLCIQTKAKISDKDRFRFSGDEGTHALKTSEEMYALFRDLGPEICRNTLDIAEMCDEITFGYDGYRMPKFPLPEDYNSEEEYLKHLVKVGSSRRWGSSLTREQQERLDYELDVICNMGFAGYFLILWDLCKYARSRDIMVGPGRGCLTKDAMVKTQRGYIPLPDVVAGDRVLTHMNRWRPVLNTQAYPCDETLLKIDSWGQALGNTMTSDHKVYASRAKPNPRAYEKNAKFLERTAADLSPAEWVEAKDLKVGDFVAVPIPPSPGLDSTVIDLADFVESTGFPERYSLDANSIVELVPVNHTYPMSKHEVADLLGVSRNTLSGVIAGSASEDSVTKTARFLKENGFDSIHEWGEYVKQNSVKRNTINRFINISSDKFLTFLGVFVGDGWLRSDQTRIGLCDQASLESNRGRLIEDLFGLSVDEQIHATNDLVQWSCSSRLIWKFIRSLIPDYQFNAQTKRLPEWVGRLTRDQKMILIKGLWAADGCSSGRETYSTSSYDLAMQVRELLWANEVRASLKIYDREETRKEYINTSRAYTVQAPRGFRNPSQSYMISDGQYLWHRIRSIEDQPAEAVYDIEVADDNSYMTDSYVVHNSAAGSAVSYCLMITAIDPIEYDLLFERFLNPSRVSMPDIDMDFDTRYRDELIAYTADKYGHDRVAQIITFSKIKARSAIKDAARVLDADFSVGNAINAAMPELYQGLDTPLSVCMAEEAPEGWERTWPQASGLRDLYVQDATSRKVIETALGLEGLTRSTGVHAAAVIIGDDELVNYLPLQKTPKGPITSQWDMGPVEDIGLVKMDYLGLRNLDVISDTFRILRKTRNLKLNINEIPTDDDATFEMLSAGRGMGVFQFENSGMRSLMADIKPQSIRDLSALTALYRPGPLEMGMHTEFVNRRRGESKISTVHPDADEILEETLGVLTYQESVMRIAQKFAGYTLAEADNLRKIMGKKKLDAMTAEKQKFIDGCVAQGYGDQVAYDWWRLIEPFSAYGFNKSHAVSYGFVSYITAYLKTNYSPEYFAALLNSVDKVEKAGGYIVEAGKCDVTVSPPSINYSSANYFPDGDTVYVGFAAIKGVGQAPAEAIEKSRERLGRPYEDFMDFVRNGPRQAKNKGIVEALIKAGCFDEFHTRGGLLQVFESIISSDRGTAKLKDAGVIGLADTIGDATMGSIEIPNMPMDQAHRLRLEKECIGTYVSAHPLDGMTDQVDREATCSIEEFLEEEGGMGRQTRWCYYKRIREEYSQG